jgi:hypothetical protein
MQEEQWRLGPAWADVLRMPGCALVELHGVVTAQAYEALHMRLSREPALDVRLIVGWSAVLAATPRSLAEAACRGTRVGDVGRIALIVPPERRAWARHHQVACQHEGLPWRADSGAPLPAEASPG